MTELCSSQGKRYIFATKFALPLRYTKLSKAQHFLILRPKRNFYYDRLKIIFSSTSSVNAKFSM